MERNRCFLFLIAAALTALLFSAGCSSGYDEQTINGQDEFTSAGKSSNNRNDKGGYDDNESNAGNQGDYDSPSASDSAMDSETAAGETDADNNQGDPGREIVESDIYKVVGSTIYVLNRYKGLIAIDMTDTANLKIVGRAAFKGLPKEMFLKDGRAVVLVNQTGYTDDGLDYGYGYYGDRSTSSVIIIDVDNPANPKVMQTYRMDGTIVDSRMVGEVVYIVSSQQQYYYYYCGTSEARGANQISVLSVNVADPENVFKVDEKQFPGNGYSVYVSAKSIYIADYPSYYYGDEYRNGFNVNYLDISDAKGYIQAKGTFKTKVYLNDRWKMYERGDVFFAVGQDVWWGNGASIVETFSVADPNNILKIGEFTVMTGQQLYATRFEGNRLYAVTYQRRDPLHVVDITDPTSMKELGLLEIPGWSTHIEIRGTKLLTVGYDDQSGTNTKVSMFDVADPANPTEMSTVEFGGGNYTTSEANEDWKAFKIFDELGMILIPTQEWSHYWYSVVYKLNIVDFNLETGLKRRGSVESRGIIRRGIVVGDYIASIGDMEVILMDAADRDNPKVLSTLRVAENVSAINKCGDKLCGASGSYYDSALHLTMYDQSKSLETFAYESPALEQNVNYYGSDARFMTKEDKGYFLTYSYGSYDESGNWNYQNYGRVHQFKFKNGENPEYLGGGKLLFPYENNQNYYYYSTWWRAAEITPNSSLAKMLSQYHWGCLVKGVGYFENCVDPITGNYLYSYEGLCYDDYGSETSNCSYQSFQTNNVYIYDVSDPTKTEFAPVKLDVNAKSYEDFYWYYGSSAKPLVTQGNNLWLTDCVSIGYDVHGREVMKCYAQAFDLTNAAAPEKKERINIPGQLTDVSADGEMFYSFDRQWLDPGSDDQYYWNYDASLCILKKKPGENKVALIKRIPLKNYYSDYYGGRYYEDAVGAGETSDTTYEIMYQDTRSSYYMETEAIYVFSYTVVGKRSKQNACGYYDSYTYEYSSTVDVYDPKTGDLIASKTLPNGYQASLVEGGGLIVRTTQYNGYYWNYYSYPDNLYYVDAKGGMRQINLPETSGYAGDYYYYGAGNKAVKIGDELFIARGWETIARVNLAQ